MSNLDKAIEIAASACDEVWVEGEVLTGEGIAERITHDLADAGLLAPDVMAYEYGDNGWDDETNSPMHYPVEPSCRDDGHYCPEPAPPRYRRLVGPWEEV